MFFINTILCASAVVMIAIGLPIAYSMAASGLFALLAEGTVPLTVLPQRFFTAIASFPLMAIIFFVIAGELMMAGGISKRLVNFASVFFRWIRGSLSFICFTTCAFFGAISGSALATAAAIGGIMYPEMIKDGDYDPPFAASIIAVGGTLGLMIPPSIPLILYGTLTGTSVGALFIAIIIPGIILTVIYMGVSYVIIVKRGMAPKKVREKLNTKKVLMEGLPALMTPVLILGGIYGGVFTPTESAIVASIYAVFIGVFVYKELNLKNAYKALENAAVTSGIIMFLIGSVSFFGWVMTRQNIPQIISQWLVSFAGNRYVFLLLINVFYLLAGMLMETSTIILLAVPLVYPVAVLFGVDPIHFGVITCMNLAMGMYTPPFGANVFFAASTTNQKVDDVFKATIPFAFAGIIGCLAITFFPVLSALLL